MRGNVMSFWKIDSLVEDFKLGKVSQNEDFKYMLLFTITLILATDSILYIGMSYDSLNSVLILFISVIGVYYCYKKYSSGDDRNFIVSTLQTQVLLTLPCA